MLHSRHMGVSFCEYMFLLGLVMLVSISCDIRRQDVMIASPGPRIIVLTYVPRTPSHPFAPSLMYSCFVTGPQQEDFPELIPMNGGDVHCTPTGDRGSCPADGLHYICRDIRYERCRRALHPDRRSRLVPGRRPALHLSRHQV